MVTSTVAAPRSVSNTTDSYLSIGEAASRFGVSIPSLRRWADSGKLAVYNTPSGHRRFRQSDLRGLLGIREQEESQVGIRQRH